MHTIILPTIEDTLHCAANLATQCPLNSRIFLQGQLGVGKTTFTKGFLQGLGFQGNVKSPTYTLVEPYALGDIEVFHFDLYRLRDPMELIDLAIEDYCLENSICLIEWPEKGGDFLPKPDLHLQLTLQDPGRLLTILSHSQSINEDTICQLQP